MAEIAGHDAFLWDSQSWAFLNSDTSGGSSSEEKLPDLGSNTQTPTGKEVVAAPPSRKKRSKKGKETADHEAGKGGGETDHEAHIWTERERRKKMRNMFTSLHALLPQLPPKADKSTIVDEAVNYIKGLEQTLQKLQKQKLEKLHGIAPINYDQTLISPQTLLSIDSREAFMADQVAAFNNNFAIIPSNTSNAIPIPRFNIPLSFQSWASQNVMLNVYDDQAFINVCAPRKPGLFATVCFVLEKHKLDLMSAHVTSDQNKTMIMIQAQAKIAPDELPDSFPLEEIYKQATLEMMTVVSSYCYQN